MPLTFPARALGDALARLQEHGVDAEPALSWLGWDGEGPLRLRRYDLLVYLWYALPTKYLAPLAVKRDMAAALAALLEEVGADGYAALCRAPEVEEMPGLWEDHDPRARRRLRELLEATGLEPPATELPAWGSVMGPIEADARDRATDALELALEAIALPRPRSSPRTSPSPWRMERAWTQATPSGSSAGAAGASRAA